MFSLDIPRYTPSTSTVGTTVLVILSQKKNITQLHVHKNRIYIHIPHEKLKLPIIRPSMAIKNFQKILDCSRLIHGKPKSL